MIIQLSLERLKRVAYRARPSSYPTNKVQVAFERPKNLEDRLWKEFTDRTESSNLSVARALLIGFDGNQLVDLRNMVRAAGVVSCASCRNVKQLRDVGDMDGVFSHIIVNFDAFETSSEAIDALFVFRGKQDKTVVLLVSSSVVADDFSPVRKSICDTTLCTPLSTSRLKRGLVEGLRNRNAICGI